MTADHLDPLRLAEHARKPYSITLGRHGDTVLAAEPLRPVLVLGPQRSRKTTGLVIPSVLDWPGPAVVTSIRHDVVEQTVHRRRQLGPVWLFQPGDDEPDPWGIAAGWSPLDDVRSWDDAVRVSRWLMEAGAVPISGATTAASGDDGFWQELGRSIIAPFLHAAHVLGEGMDAVYGWIQGDTDDHRALHDLMEQEGHRQTAQALAAFCKGAWDNRTIRSGFTVAGVQLRCFEQVSVQASTMLPDRIDVDRLIAENGTLFLCAPARNQRSLAPLFGALVQRVLWSAYGRSLKQPLDPPLLLMLDEAANIAPLSDLGGIATTAAGSGIQLCSVFHDLSQLAARYGENGARTIQNNHSCLLLLPGMRDPATLRQLDDLLGGQPLDGLPGNGLARLRQLAPGHALALYEQADPLVIRLRSSVADPELVALTGLGDHRAVAE